MRVPGAWLLATEVTGLDQPNAAGALVRRDTGISTKGLARADRRPP